MLPINVLIAAAVAAHSALLELVVESLVISLSASVTGPITLVSGNVSAHAPSLYVKYRLIELLLRIALTVFPVTNLDPLTPNSI